MKILFPFKEYEFEYFFNKNKIKNKKTRLIHSNCKLYDFDNVFYYCKGNLKWRVHKFLIKIVLNLIYLERQYGFWYSLQLKFYWQRAHKIQFLVWILALYNCVHWSVIDLYLYQLLSLFWSLLIWVSLICIFLVLCMSFSSILITL